jgi:lysozyme
MPFQTRRKLSLEKRLIVSFRLKFPITPVKLVLNRESGKPEAVIRLSADYICKRLPIEMVKKKSRIWKIIVFIFSTSIIIMLMVTLYQWITEKRTSFKEYHEFGINIPVNYTVHGIDVSKYQDVVNWQLVKNMRVQDVFISFVFVKATEGLGNEDQMFSRNWKKIRDAKLIRGAYHYFIATKSGKAQAENFINSVTLLPGDLPPVLDIEQTFGVPPEKLRQRVKEWLQTIQVYYGTAPIIYTNVDFYERYLKDDFDGYLLWAAHYLQPEQPRIYRNWSFWQHNERGRVNGCYTIVDFDVFNGDSLEFRKLLLN